MILFVPLGYLFSRLGLNYFWFTFPVTEVLTTLVGGVLLPKIYGTTEVKSNDCI